MTVLEIAKRMYRDETGREWDNPENAREWFDRAQKAGIYAPAKKTPAKKVRPRNKATQP